MDIHISICTHTHRHAWNGHLLVHFTYCICAILTHPCTVVYQQNARKRIRLSCTAENRRFSSLNIAFFWSTCPTIDYFWYEILWAYSTRNNCYQCYLSDWFLCFVLDKAILSFQDSSARWIFTGFKNDIWFHGCAVLSQVLRHITTQRPLSWFCFVSPVVEMRTWWLNVGIAKIVNPPHPSICSSTTRLHAFSSNDSCTVKRTSKRSKNAHRFPNRICIKVICTINDHIYKFPIKWIKSDTNVMSNLSFLM